MYGFNVLFIRANPAEGHVESAALSVSVGLSSSPGSTRLEILHSGVFFNSWLREISSQDAVDTGLEII
jgi:hypothetical protein